MNNRFVHRYCPAWILLYMTILLLIPVLTFLFDSNHVTQAQTIPPVRYNTSDNTIYIGADYNPADPAQAPYTGWPAHPNAPKTSIILPQIATALNNPTVLADQGNSIWLLKAHIVISQTARLELTKATLSALRLNSAPNTNQSPAFTRIVARGGSLLIQGITVTSWDTTAQTNDTNIADGRSYLLAENGGRMDILNAEVAYLGYKSGEPSGLSWRKTATRGDPTNPEIIRTGATGSISNSISHDNYFGQYSYEAYGLEVRSSQFYNNLFYGFDPHDYSTNFIVADNKVYKNGKHGIIFSRGCANNRIEKNEVFNNAEHGIMLDRGSNKNIIENNTIYGNQDGIAVFQSSDNLISNNTSRNNKRGIRINATYDNDDVFDGISARNTITKNHIIDNTQYGIYLYERADNNILTENIINGNIESGIYVKTGGNTIAGNQIQSNGHGVYIIGNQAYSTPTGPSGPSYIKPEGAPGAQNWLYRNIIENNTTSGIQLRANTNTVIGPKDITVNPDWGNSINNNKTHGITMSGSTVNSKVTANTIHGNGVDGIQVKEVGSTANTISHNSITANGGKGISLSSGANNRIAAPVITKTPDLRIATGLGPANASIEIYRDLNAQGRVYKGSVTANADGNWRFTLPAGDNPQEGPITALAVDAQGNTSEFGSEKEQHRLYVPSVLR